MSTNWSWSHFPRTVITTYEWRCWFYWDCQNVTNSYTAVSQEEGEHRWQKINVLTTYEKRKSKNLKKKKRKTATTPKSWISGYLFVHKPSTSRQNCRLLYALSHRWGSVLMFGGVAAVPHLFRRYCQEVQPEGIVVHSLLYTFIWD